MKNAQFINALPFLLAACWVSPLAAQGGAAPVVEEAEAVTPQSVILTAQAEDWIAIAPEDILVVELAPDGDGSARTVVIQLMPEPFSQPWVENIRTLARAHWWDGTSVYRAVDNWVVQWGAGEGEGFPEKALPDGMVSPEAPYSQTMEQLMDQFIASKTPTEIAALINVAPESSPRKELERILEALGPSSYAFRNWFWEGWPVAQEGAEYSSAIWPTHCYGSVGVARDLAPDTGTGAELYAVIGHGPRQLDRNIAVVGRVIEGMEHLSTVKRGTGEYGVYETRAEDTEIVSVRLASEHAASSSEAIGEITYAFEYLDTISETFARYVEIRANRNDAFYTMPAGGVDICNVQVPIRRKEQ